MPLPDAKLGRDFLWTMDLPVRFLYLYLRQCNVPALCCVQNKLMSILSQGHWLHNQGVLSLYFYNVNNCVQWEFKSLQQSKVKYLVFSLKCSSDLQHILISIQSPRYQLESFYDYTGITAGPVFCLLFRVCSDYAQPITGQATEVTCPVIARAQLISP